MTGCGTGTARWPTRPRIPDLARAIRVLRHWNGVTTLGSPAMSIFMNFLEAFERNVFEGGLSAAEHVHRHRQLQ